MDCNCGNKNEGNFPPSVFQVNSAECPVLFHKVVIPTNFGDETETPVLMGEHRNALVYYEVNGHTYLYSSDGVPTRLDRGGASVLYVEELPETSKAMQDTLYVSSRGELAVYKGGDKKILNEKPTYYTTLGSNTDGAMTQKAVTDALSALSEEVKNKLAEFKNGVVDKVMPEVNDKVSGMERFVTAKIEEMKRETSTLVNTTTNDVNLMKNSLNKHLMRNTEIKALSGSENWFKTTGEERNIFICENIIDSTANYVDGYCTHANNSKSYPQKDKQFAIRGNGKNLCFLNMATTSTTAFKNWLSSEAAKNNPVRVLYPLSSPIEEEITDSTLLTELKKLMEMRTYDGTTNISITGTDLTPEIKVKYMRKIGE